MKKLLLTLLVLVSFGANAELKYCSGKIIDLVSRNSTEGVQLRLALTDGSGISNYAAVLAPLNELNDNQKIQISFLLSAYYAKQEVTLELNTSDYEFSACNSFQNGLPIRFVRLR